MINNDRQRERDMEAARERAIEHEENMVLHEANTRLAQRGPDPEEQLRLLESVTETGLESADESLENLVAKDFPLSFYSEGGVDTTEYKWVQELINWFSKARYPHPKSGLTGLARAWASGDPADRLEPLELDELARDEAYLMGTYSRATRGEEGMQQEVASRQIVESHTFTEGTGSDPGSLLGRIRRD